ncbi:MAG: SRPBCC domain-containing protein [Acidimicrobiales bacterium]
MTVTDTLKDADRLTLTVVAEFNASPEQVWEVWENPRKLERWWGPPTYPATFTRHEFAEGGQSRYYMTGPEGDTPTGWWQFQSIDRHREIAFSHGIGGDDGEPVAGQPPISTEVTIAAIDSGTRMAVEMQFHDAAQMEMMLEMGMAEGLTQAVGQIDELLSTTSV